LISHGYVPCRVKWGSHCPFPISPVDCPPKARLPLWLLLSFCDQLRPPPPRFTARLGWDDCTEGANRNNSCSPCRYNCTCPDFNRPISAVIPLTTAAANPLVSCWEGVTGPFVSFVCPLLSAGLRGYFRCLRRTQNTFGASLLVRSSHLPATNTTVPSVGGGAAVLQRTPDLVRRRMTDTSQTTIITRPYPS
jgi:hypothetical protein